MTKKTTEKKEQLLEERRLANRGMAQRIKDHNTVLQATRNPRAAIRAYCAGNKWLTENAKAVGNW